MPEIIETKVQLAQVLQELGNTANEVALALKTKGIQGVRNTARFLNPIVRYVEGRIQADVLRLDLIQFDMLRLFFHDGTQVEVLLPQAVRQFLDGFNHGNYPELELSLNQS